MQNSNKTKIILLHEGEFPSLVELYNSFKYLTNNYGISIIKVNSMDFESSHFEDCDVIIGVRVHSPLSYGVLKTALSLGKKLFYFLDDDLKDIPKSTFWYPERKKWLLKCLGLCEGLLTTSKLIADEYKDFIRGNQIVLVNTAVDPNSIISPNEKNNAKVKILIAASEGHAINYEKIVKPIIPKLLNRYGDKVEFHFIGIYSGFEDMVKNGIIHFTPQMLMEEYIVFMKSHQFDIGLAVLNPDHFTERKYFNKFIEYSRYGICGVYSKCMPYQLVVNDGENGFLVENDPNVWYDVLCRIIENPIERVQCILNAQKYLRTMHNEQYLFKKLVEDAPELIAFKSITKGNCRGNCLPLYRTRNKLYKICEASYQTINSIFRYGLKTTIQKISRKISG